MVSTFEEMKQCLNRNEILFIFIDGRRGRHPVEVHLLERNLFFSPGVLVLAKETGATALPFLGLRQKRSNIKFIVHKKIPLELSDLGNPDRIREEMQKCVDFFENHIIENPNNFYMFIHTRSSTDFRR
ncbi:MAG: hypothetical protein ACETWM_09065 [Candidatus Lokiarchaeia archaeon]